MNGKRDGKGISISGLRKKMRLIKISKDHHLSSNHNLISFFMFIFILSGDSMYDGEWKDDKMEGK